MHIFIGASRCNFLLRLAALQGRAIRRYRNHGRLFRPGADCLVLLRFHGERHPLLVRALALGAFSWRGGIRP